MTRPFHHPIHSFHPLSPVGCPTSPSPRTSSILGWGSLLSTCTIARWMELQGSIPKSGLIHKQHLYMPPDVFPEMSPVSSEQGERFPHWTQPIPGVVSSCTTISVPPSINHLCPLPYALIPWTLLYSSLNTCHFLYVSLASSSYASSLINCPSLIVPREWVCHSPSLLVM